MNEINGTSWSRLDPASQFQHLVYLRQADGSVVFDVVDAMSREDLAGRLAARDAGEPDWREKVSQ